MGIGIALLGAGIFAVEHQLPAIKACSSLSLKAIYSRSQKTAEDALKDAGEDVDIYFDSLTSPSQSLEALLNRDDIKAVIIAVPILAQPHLIRKAMAAGKHIMSEKPIAKDVATAEDLLTFYQPFSKKVVWAVGENFRFWPSVSNAFQILQESISELVTFSVNFYTLVDQADKYLETEWRSTPGYQGGFLLDGGVHFAAILRYLLSALGQKVTNLSAFTALLQERLPPVDTIHAVMEISNGRNGTFGVSVGTKFRDNFEINVVTDTCSVTIRPTEVVTTTKNASGEEQVSKHEFARTFGVAEEIVAFAEAFEGKCLDPRLTPEAALGDLRLIEAMLRSGEAGGQVQALD
ncbi:hypothetical protein BGZ61DRAFT_372685 [Ilyonectria robusta]|uniref:uncharacterized protein n=1 Tax=Ilyonectria robusta TaxID=1079257 RepID=UPI001E8E0449|nr:uncharacterized protein BGZ61DRAFT_372685 [Ilyonectria robusta]KAH8656281.1 hypothetical protein BGZ61DRAFT_372685 [Ilyonectria robusta]